MAEVRGWQCDHPLSNLASRLLDLYAPLCAGLKGRAFTLAHLGQSIDGYIAGKDGLSRGLSSPENIVHLHRLRALFDVVMVGCRTAAIDDPRLTTRLVPGPNPARVVLDPGLKSSPELAMFEDEQARTLLICAANAPVKSFPSSTELIRMQQPQAALTVALVLERLRAEALPRVFIEGGGVTVSRALGEGVLDRLHLSVAPVIIGDGCPGIRLPAITKFQDAHRPPSSHFEMDGDVLFDFEFTASAPV